METCDIQWLTLNLKKKITQKCVAFIHVVTPAVIPYLWQI